MCKLIIFHPELFMFNMHINYNRKIERNLTSKYMLINNFPDYLFMLFLHHRHQHQPMPGSIPTNCIFFPTSFLMFNHNFYFIL